MTLDDDEAEVDGAGPIDLLETYCEARGWTNERLGGDELVATVPGSWTQYELRAVWRSDDRVLQMLALPDIRVAADKRAAVYEVLGLINEQLWLGHFELWSSSGLLLYRNAMLVEGDGSLQLDQAETLIETAVDECERFYPVFQFVLWGGKSPVDAIAAALIETRGEA